MSGKAGGLPEQSVVRVPSAEDLRLCWFCANAGGCAGLTAAPVNLK